jgi:hypothetical protein
MAVEVGTGPCWADVRYAALGHAAFRDDAFMRSFTPEDIKEILLQQAIYCGVPAANHAVKEAGAIIAELGLLKG